MNFEVQAPKKTLWDLIKSEPKCQKYVEMLKKLNELISLVGKRNSRAAIIQAPIEYVQEMDEFVFEEIKDPVP